MAMIALLAFISQSFAVVNIPCAGMDNHATSAAMTDRMAMGSTMAHASHDKPGDSGANVDADCCKQKQCSQANCISLGVAVIGADSSLPVLFSQTLHSDYFVSYLNAERSSLFRPPISR